jgi:hypothetical protein
MKSREIGQVSVERTKNLLAKIGQDRSNPNLTAESTKSDSHRAGPVWNRSSNPIKQPEYTSDPYRSGFAALVHPGLKLARAKNMNPFERRAMFESLIDLIFNSSENVHDEPSIEQHARALQLVKDEWGRNFPHESFDEAISNARERNASYSDMAI